MHEAMCGGAPRGGSTSPIGPSREISAGLHPALHDSHRDTPNMTTPFPRILPVHACRRTACLKMVCAASLLFLPAVGNSGSAAATPVRNPAQQAAHDGHHARHPQTAPRQAAPATRADMLKGAYGPYRANNDLLYYHLHVRVDPGKKSISGMNTIRFRMLEDGTRIQIDLQQPMAVDRITFGGKTLAYERDEGAVFIDFPETLKKGGTYAIDFYFSGRPYSKGRFGNFTFATDAQGHPWIFTASEDDGASVWWPNKEQWRDEVTHMDISVAVPDGLTDVSNGRFAGKKALGDGYTEWNWQVHYPINNYDVALNIADYTHFSDAYGNYYVLPQDLARAKEQFKQVKGMMDAYQHYFGEYPFAKDGYKLVEVPYSGMEHQSAVSYGNKFENGYLGRDWTGVGISPRFDFIIIHESAHEWFGNSITASDRADMWIHEAWATYLESLYVEYHWGKSDALRYLDGYKPKVRDLRPIVAEPGVAATPPEDQYFKGALMINTLRSVIDDDARWWKLLHDFYQHFKYRNISTGDVVAYFNEHAGMNLTPIFDQYLHHTRIPTLELLFGESKGMVMYKWKADVDDFAMPVRVGRPGHWQIIRPTTHWQWMQTPLTKDQFDVATDLYYVDVDKP